MNTTETLSAFVATTPYEALPAAAIGRAKLLISDDCLLDKFHRCAGPILPKRTIDPLVERILSLDSEFDVGPIIGLTRGAGRAESAPLTGTVVS